MTSQRCPRCSAPVVGDYKFCPACAYRLRSGVAEPAAPPPPRGGGWKTGFLATLVVAGLLAGALGYVLLLNPSWMRPEPPSVTASPPVGSGFSLTKPLTVDELPGLLVELPPGVATMYPNFDQAGGEPEYLEAHVAYALWAAKFETTQGMYAECLRDVADNRDRIPPRWLETRSGPVAPKDVQLGYHAPLAWRIYDPDDETRVVGWRNDPADANLPVTQITFHDAHGFAEWATARFQRGDRKIKFDLPVLWEWQRAARAGRLENHWPWGEEKLRFACNSRAFWGAGNRGSLLPVMWWYGESATGGATADGLFSMAGNAREMARSQLPQKQHDPIGGRSFFVWAKDPTAPTGWMCGGSYKSGIDDCGVEGFVNVAFDTSYDDLGFRLFVREPIE